MKFLKQGVCLALLGAGLAAVPAMVSSPAGAASGPGSKAAAPGSSLVQQIRSSAGGQAAVSPEAATGHVGFVRATSAHGDLLPSVRGDSASAAAAKSRSYLDRYAPAFGARPGQLSQSGITSYRYGWVVTYTQSYRGVPVFAGQLKANVNREGALTAVDGFAAPGLSLSTTPRLSKTQAADKALLYVRAQPPGDGAADLSGIEAANNTLSIYRTGSTHGVKGKAVLAYVMEITNEHNIRDQVIVDANTGKLLNRWSMIDNDLSREFYEADEDRNLDLVWEEGDPFPGTLNQSQANMIASTGDSYWLYRNSFDRDNWDGNPDTIMRTIDNDPAIECPNANWNGQTTNYCTGVDADDVVSHEWSHAYTEGTSGLIYQWQSGAMNEGMSDIFGETIDLINGREDAGEGDLTTPRPVGQCSTHTRGQIGLTINSPAEIAGPCQAAAAAFGPVFDKTGVTTDVVVGADSADSGSSTDGCDPLSNAAEVNGRFAYVDRGGCTFQAKADNAAAAGATGIIIGDNNPDEAPFSVSATSDIYGLMIRKSDGAKIKSATAPVNVTIKDIDPEAKADSYRWLVGEKAAAFGGAIRDMWDPTCYGDPGKVSDVEYKCSTDDAGGVHSNSGVVNHSYSLLVDGGTYNGVTVNGIGLDKAAHIYWQAQLAHLTPTSDFPDLADALATSCNELVGQPLNALSTEPDEPGAATTVITTADCASVAAAADAVELRKDPTSQCHFEPLLAKNAPAPCGKDTHAKKVWGDNFNHGLDKWKQSETTTYRKGHGFRWKTTRAPHHKSRTAFATDPDAGSCAGDSDDLSSRNSLRTRKRIRIPAGGSPRMVFSHYVATESGFDGGNVRIKVNHGKWRLVPHRAWTFNGPNAVLEPGTYGGQPYNTNPMAGQPAFTGTDGGQVYGSWGRSQINLHKMGVRQGDHIRVRLDMGRDGCGGNDGWYVDNLKILICKKNRDRVAVGTKQ